MEKQMTIDDYLNRDSVAIMENTASKTDADVIQPELVDYNNLKKEELIKIIEQKDSAITSGLHTIEKLKEEHGSEIQNMNEFYQKKINELSHLISYYERKLKVLKDIITIETGGEK